MTLKTNLAAVLVAISGVALGCGGGDSSSSSTSTTATAQPVAQFVSEADGLCTAENKKRDDAGPPPSFNPAKATPEQLKSAVPYFQNDIAVTTDEVSQLSKIAPPQGHETEWSTVLDDIQTSIIPAFNDAITAAKAGDVKGFNGAFAGIEKKNREATQLVSKIGLKVCGK